MAHRLAPQAANDLDEIWFFIARESGSVEIADNMINAITSRFFLLSSYPHLGRVRDEEFGLACRSFGIGEYVIIYSVEENNVLILRVLHGRRDIEALFEN